ncbi:hypothetical protein [Sinomonas atrocyanea]|jgi:transcriptional regulator with XRE-family HTH domain
MNKGMPDFAARLNALFERVPDAETGKPYSNVAVAAALEGLGTPVTPGYLGQLRSARKNDPSARLVGALAQFFGVPLGYFFDGDSAAERITAQLEQLAAIRDQRIRGIMTRAQGISPEGLTQVASILEHIRKLEGLNADDSARPPKDE